MAKKSIEPEVDATEEAAPAADEVATDETATEEAAPAADEVATDTADESTDEPSARRDPAGALIIN